MAPTKARTLSMSASSVKLALPTPVCTMPAFSARNSTWPPLTAWTASVTFWVTVPSRGLGISPRGPRIFPSRPTSAIISGVAMARSKSICPPCTFSTLFDDFETHRARRADHHLARRVEVVRVEVHHLLLRDLADLIHRNPADRDAFAGGLRPLLDARRLLQKIGIGRRLGDEGKTAVAIGGDHH